MSNPGSGGTAGRISTSQDVNLSNPAYGQVLTYNSGTGTWNNFTGSTISINAQTGTSYSADLTDIGGEIEMSNTSANTVTILPQGTTANTTVTWPAGANFNIRQMNTGLTSIVAGTGVTLRAPNGANISSQYSTATVIRSSSDVWIVDGGVTT